MVPLGPETSWEALGGTQRSGIRNLACEGFCPGLPAVGMLYAHTAAPSQVLARLHAAGAGRPTYAMSVASTGGLGGSPIRLLWVVLALALAAGSMFLLMPTGRWGHIRAIVAGKHHPTTPSPSARPARPPSRQSSGILERHAAAAAALAVPVAESPEQPLPADPLAALPAWLTAAGSSFNLSRPQPVVELEQLLEAKPEIGACYQQRQLLQHMPDFVCRRLQVRRSAWLLAGWLGLAWKGPVGGGSV